MLNLRKVPDFLAPYLMAGLALIMMAGCSSLVRNPVPIEDIHSAEISGMMGVRAWGGQFSPVFQADLVASARQEAPGTFPLDDRGLPVYNAIALSGGGPNGAFGAGILNGWSKTGKRPDFKIVTGISTGALIAPFTFLGPEYDEQLKTVFTTIRTRDILERSGIIKILVQSEAIANSLPLERLINAYFDDGFIKAVAAAHNMGRRLYVGTTNMDAQKLVIWNMGAIANSGHPDAPKLFRNVILASSAIPGVFPPVFINVEVGSKHYDEMHADGGTVTQVFFHGGIMNLGAAAQDSGRSTRDGYSGTMYVIRNGKLGPEPAQIERRLGTISRRALRTLVKYAASNDMNRIHDSAVQANLYFKYTAIPDSFEYAAEEIFDPREMKRLYDLGYEMAVSGSAWRAKPPKYLLLQP